MRSRVITENEWTYVTLTLGARGSVFSDMVDMGDKMNKRNLKGK